jgi:hypothetical protein
MPRPQGVLTPPEEVRYKDKIPGCAKQIKGGIKEGAGKVLCDTKPNQMARPRAKSKTPSVV